MNILFVSEWKSNDTKTKNTGLIINVLIQEANIFNPFSIIKT